MGKGGEAAVGQKGGNVDEGKFKLAQMDTAQLQKWATAYGIDSKITDRVSLLSELNPFADGILDKRRPANLPLARPEFTLTTIKNAIPAHCFKRNTLKSFQYLFQDFFMIAVVGVFAYKFIPSLPFALKCIAWPIYMVVQGCIMTGVWVLAHECGHQAFSDSEWINNIVGSICHSALLVPYHSWRITHRLHHSNTGSCENDEVFAPSTRSDWGSELLRETPMQNIVGIFLMLTVGWPGYLLGNFTGPAKYRGKNTNHFSPSAVFFTKEEYWLVVQSDIVYFFALCAIAYCVSTFGIMNVGAYYLFPYLIVNCNLVLITYLQHTDVFLPHFRGDEWNWLRGALCTIDRPYGYLYDHCLHRITDTHVCHHLFSKMPFYHAEEATIHIKRVLGKYYLRDETPIPLAVYRSYSTCQFVEDSGDVVFYKNIK